MGMVHRVYLRASNGQKKSTFRSDVTRAWQMEVKLMESNTRGAIDVKQKQTGRDNPGGPTWNDSTSRLNMLTAQVLASSERSMNKNRNPNQKKSILCSKAFKASNVLKYKDWLERECLCILVADLLGKNNPAIAAMSRANWENPILNPRPLSVLPLPRQYQHGTFSENHFCRRHRTLGLLQCEYAADPEVDSGRSK